VSERERGERVGEVVASCQGQAVRPHQSFLPEREPRAIADAGNAEVSLFRLVQEEGNPWSKRRHHGTHPGVSEVDYRY